MLGAVSGQAAALGYGQIARSILSAWQHKENRDAFIIVNAR
jgi:hypothetical protein